MRFPGSFSLLAALLGASVSVTMATVFGTAIFNGMMWYVLHSGIPPELAYGAVSRHQLYPPLVFLNTLLGGMLSGYVAARISSKKHYLSAFVAALFAMACFLIMFISPMGQMSFDANFVLTNLVLPIPCALLGAYVFLRWKSGQNQN
jgi:hypothetical protein